MTTEMIRMEEATLINLQELLELSRTTFYDTFAPDNTAENVRHYLDTSLTEAILQTELSNPDSLWYIARQGTEAVGYLKLNRGPAQTELKDPEALEIERIYVLASHQGLRIGQMLLQQAIDTARMQQLEYIWLGVWEHNVKAIGFYIRNGFSAFDTHAFRLGDDLQTDILMKLQLQDEREEC